MKTKDALSLLLIVFASLLSCNTHSSKKPFVITSISVWRNHDTYYYIDSSGGYHTFEADHNKYNVGDTIR